ncbi:MAG: hypothetical protein FWH53_00125 [Leptospirales bacterium]|nr:hypothetical protein [Leptospirales bacterium]
MILRKKFLNDILDRSWKEIVKGQITVKRQIENENGGFLNAVRDIVYDTFVISHCDIFIKTDENRNSKVGVKVLGDAAVWLEEVHASGLRGTDIIVIGGIEYSITKIDTFDSVYKDRSRVELVRL